MTIKVIHIVEAYCLYYAAEQSIKINDLSEHLVMLQEHIKKIDKAAFGNLLKPIKIRKHKVDKNKIVDELNKLLDEAHKIELSRKRDSVHAKADSIYASDLLMHLADFLYIIYALSDLIIQSRLEDDFWALSDGFSWNHFVVSMTKLMRSNNLPYKINKATGAKTSDFVEIIWAIQEALPIAMRRHQHSKDALGQAIVRARRNFKFKPILLLANSPFSRAEILIASSQD